MQKKSEIFLFVIITSIILSNPTNGNIVNLQILKTSSLLTNNRIIGYSGWFEFKNDGNCTVSGTYSNTYILRDLVINDSIWIENSCIYFKIENCTVNRVLVLYLTDNNIITENIVTFNEMVGLWLRNSNFNLISQNIVRYNEDREILCVSNRNIIFKNTICFNDFGLFLDCSCHNAIFNNINGEDETYDEDELGYENFSRSCLLFLFLILSFIGFIILLNILEKFKNK